MIKNNLIYVENKNNLKADQFRMYVMQKNDVLVIPDEVNFSWLKGFFQKPYL